MLTHNRLRSVVVGFVTPILLYVATGARSENISPSESEEAMLGKSVRINWLFNAPPASVWAVWTEAEAVKQWFGSNPDGEVLAAELNVRPGGTFKVTFADGDGTEHTASGLYQQVDPYRLLTFTWNWKSEPGVETLVTVALIPDGAGTNMQFEHGRLISASSHNYEQGWRGTFEKFEKVLARRAAARE